MSDNGPTDVLLDLARLALDVPSEADWWSAFAAAASGPLFAALVVTVNVINARERYGWFGVVHPVAARQRLPIGSPMDTILTHDHPFSIKLRDGPAADPFKVTDLVSERQWRNGAAYGRMRELTDGVNHLLLHIPRHPPYLESVSIVRADRDFDAKDMALAQQAQTVVQLAVSHLRHVAERDLRYGPLAAQEAAAAALALGITDRERVVLELASAGLAADAIAHRLVISPRTVHKHKQNLYRKLGVADQTNATIRARLLGLIPDLGPAAGSWPRTVGRPGVAV